MQMPIWAPWIFLFFLLWTTTISLSFTVCQELCPVHYHMHYYFIYFLQLNEIGAISIPILQRETLRLRKGR